MANRLKTLLRDISRAVPSAFDPAAQVASSAGRIDRGRPVAVIDIGSNSVRLVVYEGLTRSPTPIFNEKTMCGLGRNIATTGRLDDGAVAKALAALRRYVTLCRMLDVGEVRILATAAARDASNGKDFIAAAEAICGQPIPVLAGKREAHLAALGVMSGIHNPDGIVGDLGGGSLELVDIKGLRIGEGITLPLGGLRLQDEAGGQLKRAEKIARKTLDDAKLLEKGRGRTFYAVGGTWRNLARLHMTQRGYPLNVMHEYTLPAGEVVDFCRAIMRQPPEALSHIEVVSDQRQPLLAYGAAVLEKLVLRMQPQAVTISVLGVREGLLFEALDETTRAIDPLIAASAELCALRSRSPLHALELAKWTGDFFSAFQMSETAEDERLRVATCLLADIGWRAHPDYRGEQSLNIIAHAAFVGIDHPGRAFMALSVFFRHAGLADDTLSPRLRELVGSRMHERARLLGALMRVAYLVSAAMPGVLPRVPLVVSEGRLYLSFPADLQQLAGDRLGNRLRQLGKVVNAETGFLFQEA